MLQSQIRSCLLWCHERSREVIMDVVTVAGTVMSVLLPYVAKGAEEFAKEAPWIVEERGDA